MKDARRWTGVGVALAVAVGLLAGASGWAGPTRPAEVKVGIVTFLSGAAAAPFGIPARNAAEVLIEELNAAARPLPTTPGGSAGSPSAP